MPAACPAGGRSSHREHLRLEDRKATLDREWNEARSRAGQIDEVLRGQRQSLEELRAEHSQRARSKKCATIPTANIYAKPA